MNQLSDQLNIDTPELVTIEMPLAGVGSRFIALLIDMLLWFAGLLVLFFLAVIFLRPGAPSASSNPWPATSFAILTRSRPSM